MKSQFLSLSRFWSTTGCKQSPFQCTLIYLSTLQLQTLIPHLPWRIMDSNIPEQPLCTSTLMVHTPSTAPLKGPWSFFFFLLHFHHSILSTVGYATMNDATTNECHNEQFLSTKSGCYNEHRCYNERGGILPADVARMCVWHVGPSRFD